MRKLIFAINLTIDGCCDHTKFTGADEMLEYYRNLMQDVDLLMYGRKTYQLMVPYWPDIAKNPSGKTKAEVQFAKTLGGIRKVVFSRSLVTAEDENTSIVSIPPQDEILKLKQQQGKNMLLGGIDIPSQLMALGLVDEYHFVIHPTLAGDGRRLLEGINIQEQLQLKLVGKTILKSGCIALHYLRSS